MIWRSCAPNEYKYMEFRDRFLEKKLLNRLRALRKALNRKQRMPKNGMGPMLEGLLGSYGVGKVGFSEAKLSIQFPDTDI